MLRIKDWSQLVGRYDLDRLNATSRSLGNGSFTVNYNNATGDILTSTGQITGLSEKEPFGFTSFIPTIF